MAKLNTVPKVVDISHYAGDTLSIRVNVAPEVVGGRNWFAQVRRSRHSTVIEATFVVLPDATGANLILTAADSLRLAAGGPFIGFWDVQLGDARTDPVTTLAQGEFELEQDVTRISA